MITDTADPTTASIEEANAERDRLRAEVDRMRSVYEAAIKAGGAIFDTRMCFSKPDTWIADATQTSHVKLSVRQYHALDELCCAINAARTKETLRQTNKMKDKLS